MRNSSISVVTTIGFLAELADLHGNYTGLLERGGSNPTLLAIVALVRALKVHPYKLIEKVR
jgi:hypothetical protein